MKKIRWDVIGMIGGIAGVLLAVIEIGRASCRERV